MKSENNVGLIKTRAGLLLDDSSLSSEFRHEIKLLLYERLCDILDVMPLHDAPAEVTSLTKNVAKTAC